MRMRRAALTVFVAVAVGAILWFAWPQPVPADLATVAPGPMEVSVEDEGRTRVRHVYTVSAPVAGRVLRTPRRVGDPVEADETIVAVMRETAPALLDVRTREELRAALQAAEAAVELAEHEVPRIESALNLARREFERMQSLAKRDLVSAEVLDRARVDVQTNEHALDIARAQLQVRRGERAILAARLAESPTDAERADVSFGIALRAPVSGRVLAIHQESEAVVPAGTPLMDIGDPRDLEVVVDLLSSEAVRVREGAPVRIEGWGEPALEARVTRVDPAGFTKISALGIEEQRVRTVIDFVDPAETWTRLGHDFRVTARITLWRADEVLTVPLAALFRQGDEWAVYAVRDGRAQTTRVEIGRRNAKAAVVLGGLSAGDQIILYPSDRIADGTAVAPRETR